jgi:hypothetical protein
LSASFGDFPPKIIYCILFSSKNEEKTVRTLADAGKEDQYLNIAVDESVLL